MEDRIFKHGQKPVYPVCNTKMGAAGGYIDVDIIFWRCWGCKIRVIDTPTTETWEGYPLKSESKLMTAKEAKQVSDANQKTLGQAELDDVLVQIGRSARYGYYSMSYEVKTSKSHVIEFLESLGYTVITLKITDIIRISWI